MCLAHANKMNTSYSTQCLSTLTLKTCLIYRNSKSPLGKGLNCIWFTLLLFVTD